MEYITYTIKCKAPNGVKRFAKYTLKAPFGGFTDWECSCDTKYGLRRTKAYTAYLNAEDNIGITFSTLTSDELIYYSMLTIPSENKLFRVHIPVENIVEIKRNGDKNSVSTFLWGIGLFQFVLDEDEKEEKETRK